MGHSSKWHGLNQLYLGSKSWSRRQLLEEMGISVAGIVVSDFDESSLRESDPNQLVMRLAHAKADSILRNHDFSRPHESTSDDNLCGKAVLITGDSVVTHKNRVLEKPESKEQARELLRSYATAPATTVSSIVVVDLASERRFEGVAAAEVYFHPMPSHVIDELVESGTSMETAGGLRVEHPAVQPYIDYIIGEKSAVMGFSQSLAESLIEKALNWRHNT